MSVAPSFDDLLTVGQAEAQARRPDLKFREGDVTVANLHAAATMADLVIRWGAQAFRDTFFDGASGDALTTLVDDHCNIQRKAATKAQVGVTFTRVTTVAGTIPAGTRVATGFDPDGNQVTFTLDSPVAVGAGVLSVSGTATAQTEGRVGNVRAATVSQMLDQVFDTFRVSNPADATGGDDEESDEDLRQRAKTYMHSLERGTLASIEAAALGVPGVAFANATEDPDTQAVSVMIAAEAPDDVTLQQVAEVSVALEAARSAGTQVQVVAARRVAVDLVIALTATRPGLDSAAISSIVASAVAARIDKCKVGEPLYLASVVAAVGAVAPDSIFDVAILAMALDGSDVPVQDLIPGRQPDTLSREAWLVPGTIDVV